MRRSLLYFASAQLERSALVSNNHNVLAFPRVKAITQRIAAPTTNTNTTAVYRIPRASYHSLASSATANKNNHHHDIPLHTIFGNPAVLQQSLVHQSPARTATAASLPLDEFAPLPVSLQTLYNASGVKILSDKAPPVASDAFLRAVIENRPLPTVTPTAAAATQLATATREDAFYVCDLAHVVRQYRQWQARLPNVECFYAVKSMPDPLIVRTLAALGASFDCASQEEIDMVLNCGQGVTADRIIFAHPCKLTSHLRHANKLGVSMMTFDSEAELHKIARLYPEGAELVLRIATDGSSAKCNLSAKFGAQMDMVPGLLDTARELNLNVTGVSFHVGSQCTDPSAFSRAIADAKAVFEMASMRGFAPNLLDVGGGFPGSTNGVFDDIATNLAEAIDEHFPADSGVRVIAEPGRYFCAASHTLVTAVHGKKQVAGKNVLFVDDGVYHSFNCIIYDHQKPIPRALRADAVAQTMANMSEMPLVNSKIFGPTCDSVDVVADNILLPEDVSPGDWLVFEEMGAYTRASASNFNGYSPQNSILYVCSDLTVPQA